MLILGLLRIIEMSYIYTLDDKVMIVSNTLRKATIRFEVKFKCFNSLDASFAWVANEKLILT